MTVSRTSEYHDDPLNDKDCEDKSNKASIYHLPYWSSIIVIGIALCLYGWVFYMDGRVPDALMIAEETKNSGSFIGERAHNILRGITDIGPRVVGTIENEETTVQFLSDQIRAVMNVRHELHDIEFDVQLASGEYFLEFKPIGLVNKYNNVHNVIARLSDKRIQSNHSLLFNCHFDTVPFSQGASDDAMSCAVMLEILRVLAVSPEVLKHNVMFLFNGAEENPLQAAHGFISQHKWFKEVRAVINLEAGGAGGREVMFQAGPEHPWLLRHYANSAPHPHAQVIFEEVFQTGKVPSDTDFRLFRDFGNVPAVDMAIRRNGYVYHTRFDTFDKVPIGSIQHMGDNALALSRSILNGEELQDPSKYSKGKMIFFDILGWSIVKYTATVGTVINSLIVVISLAVIIYSIQILGKEKPILDIYKKLLVSMAIQLLGWLLAEAICVVLAFIIDKLHYSLSWYYKSWILFGLYFCPALIGMSLPLVLFHLFQSKPNNLCLGLQVQLHTYATTAIWTIFLFLATCFGMRTSYLLMLVVAFSTTAHLISVVIRLQRTVHGWLWVYLTAITFPMIFNMYQSELTLSTLIPILGRVGNSKNVELFTALMAANFCILIGSCFVPLLLLLRKPFYTIYGLLGISLFALFIVAFTPLGFPYSENENSPAAQRYIIYHTQRTFYDENKRIKKQDAGYFMWNLDRNGPHILKKYIPELANATCLGLACTDDLFCGLPVYKSRISSLCQESIWIPAEPPHIAKTTNLELMKSKDVKSNIRRVYFNITTPDHMNIIISPKEGIVLNNWSLIDRPPTTEAIWRDRPVYFITFSYGVDFSEWGFWLDLEVPSNWNKPIVEIAVTGHYMYTQNYFTDAYDEFLQKFPKWTYAMPFVANYKSWVF